MVKPEELRFICTRCGNCCTDKDTFVNITYIDIIRLKTELNPKELLNIIGFYVFDETPTKGVLNRMVISPIKTERGLAFTGLLKNSLGVCYFYDKEKSKCLIYKIRPMFCRTFPFSFNIKGPLSNKVEENISIIYTEKAKNYCPGLALDSPIIDYEYWSQIGKKTLKDLEKSSLFNERWNNRVRKGKIAPKVENYLNTILMIDKDTPTS
jgi:Fe-S-cluster containining protein